MRVAPRRRAASVAAAPRPLAGAERRRGSSALPVRRPRRCAIAIGAAVAALLFISASMTVEVFYVRDVVGAGPTGYALVFAALDGRDGARRDRGRARG